ncbi:MAG: hypothetical protein IPP94_18240 [Ignavibacteria bacterium]|nr:hypothetical protein [Ignavibacteria bacterium]
MKREQRRLAKFSERRRDAHRLSVRGVHRDRSGVRRADASDIAAGMDDECIGDAARIGGDDKIDGRPDAGIHDAPEGRDALESLRVFARVVVDRVRRRIVRGDRRIRGRVLQPQVDAVVPHLAWSILHVAHEGLRIEAARAGGFADCFRPGGRGEHKLDPPPRQERVHRTTAERVEHIGTGCAAFVAHLSAIFLEQHGRNAEARRHRSRIRVPPDRARAEQQCTLLRELIWE